jgi:universal stress protein A
MLPIRIILCPTDFSERSAYAFDVACSMARDYRARLVALHVLEPPIVHSDLIAPVTNDAAYEETMRHRLSQLVKPQLRIQVEHVLSEGEPASEIIRFANGMNADLIVMGSHGRGGLARVLMGSVAEQVLRRASCPLMIVKAPIAFVPESGEFVPEETQAPSEASAR